MAKVNMKMLTAEFVDGVGLMTPDPDVTDAVLRALGERDEARQAATVLRDRVENLVLAYSAIAPYNEEEMRQLVDDVGHLLDSLGIEREQYDRTACRLEYTGAWELTD